MPFTECGSIVIKLEAPDAPRHRWSSKSMNAGVACRTQCDQIVRFVFSGTTAELFVMNFQVA